MRIWSRSLAASVKRRLCRHEAKREYNDGLFAARDCDFEWLKCLCEVWLGCSELAIYRHVVAVWIPLRYCRSRWILNLGCEQGWWKLKRATRSVLRERSSWGSKPISTQATKEKIQSPEWVTEFLWLRRWDLNLMTFGLWARRAARLLHSAI